MKDGVLATDVIDMIIVIMVFLYSYKNAGS